MMIRYECVLTTVQHYNQTLNIESDNLFPSSTVDPHKSFSDASVKNPNGGTASDHCHASVTLGAKYFFDSG